MARVTIEDCVEHIPNRFLLVQTAVRRTRQLMEGSKPLLRPKNRPSVVALREIAARLVRPVLDPSRPPDEEAPTRRPAAEEDILMDAAIEEVGVEDLHAARSMRELTDLEGLPEDGFHEIVAEEAEEGEPEEEED